MRFAALFTGIAALAGLVAAQDYSDAGSGLEKRALAKVFRKCKGNKEIAITFDDGPHIWDEDLRATLAKYKAKATFFVNVNNWGCAYADERIKGMRDLFKDGHEFASHTATHRNLTTLTWNQMHNEMWLTEEMLMRVLGVNPAFIRPPYGSYNNQVLSAIAARNQTCIMWDFDSEDTLGRSANSTKAMYKAIVDNKVKNVLALNHSIMESTVKDVIPYALNILSKAGYKFVPVSQCIGQAPYREKKKQGTKNASWKCPPLPPKTTTPAGSATTTSTNPYTTTTKH